MNCRLPIADLRIRESSNAPVLRLRIANRKSRIGNGFSLTEVLIVIGIIVLLIALAVPALSVISGSRSIDGAENNVSAMLGRVRADAMGLQKDTGILFFLDPATGAVTLAQVQAVDGPATPLREVYLDLVPDRDWLALPTGVSSQVIDNANVTAGVRGDDGYIGFNTETTGTATLVPYGGVILFDSSGRLVAKSYAFRGVKTMPGGGTSATDIFRLLTTGTITDTGPLTGTDLVPAGTLTRAQYGLILFDREAFLANWNVEDVQISGGSYPGSAEANEEIWLDQNAVPLMINRYNGTLLRGE